MAQVWDIMLGPSVYGDLGAVRISRWAYVHYLSYICAVNAHTKCNSGSYNRSWLFLVNVSRIPSSDIGL